MYTKFIALLQASWGISTLVAKFNILLLQKVRGTFNTPF